MTFVRVKLDGDLPASIGEPTRAAGFEVATVVGQGWSGAGDDALWKAVVAERAMLVTADKGFGDIRTYPPGQHHGLIVLRPARESISAYRGLIEELISKHDLRSFAGALVVASPGGVRVRRASAHGR